MENKAVVLKEEIVKAFAKFLVDRAEGGVLYVGDIADLRYEFLGGENDV